MIEVTKNYVKDLAKARKAGIKFDKPNPGGIALYAAIAEYNAQQSVKPVLKRPVMRSERAIAVPKPILKSDRKPVEKPILKSQRQPVPKPVLRGRSKYSGNTLRSQLRLIKF